MLVDSRAWEETFNGKYRGDVEFGALMKDHTSLAIGGPADVLVSPADPLSVKNIAMVSRGKNIPVMVLGGGTNLLVSDSGIEGVVIDLRSFRMIHMLREEGDEIELFVEAGVPLQMLVNYCRENGYAGMEGLTGIPGTFGGAIRGNAGSYGCEIKDVVRSVVIMYPDGRLDRREAAALGFGYRTSGIRPDDIVLNATVKLNKEDREAVAGRMQKYITEKMKAQPISSRSAGCVFKNPAAGPAGRLIEESGCKGMKIGGIEVSSLHANFFVNRGNGTAADYVGLMQEVALIVEKKKRHCAGA